MLLRAGLVFTSPPALGERSARLCEPGEGVLPGTRHRGSCSTPSPRPLPLRAGGEGAGHPPQRVVRHSNRTTFLPRAYDATTEEPCPRPRDSSTASCRGGFCSGRQSLCRSTVRPPGLSPGRPARHLPDHRGRHHPQRGESGGHRRRDVTYRLDVAYEYEVPANGTRVRATATARWGRTQARGTRSGRELPVGARGARRVRPGMIRRNRSSAPVSPGSTS